MIRLSSAPGRISPTRWALTAGWLLLGCAGSTVHERASAPASSAASERDATEHRSEQGDQAGRAPYQLEMGTGAASGQATPEQGGEPSSKQTTTDSAPPQPRSASPAADISLLHPPAAHPWLGVELRATEATRPGVQIRRVVPGSPAERASLRAGDVVLEIDGRPTTSPEQLAKTVREQRVDSQVPLLLARSGKMHLLRIELTAMPEFEDRLRLAFIGRPAPEISGVVTFQGEAASLRELRGDVVVLEFWASFCGVCRMMGPLLDRWDERYRALGGHVVGITVDPPSVGARVARQAQMGYTLASDPDSTITREYWASQIPTLFVIDRAGIVRDAVVGYSGRRLEQVEALIEDLLRQPRP